MTDSPLQRGAGCPGRAPHPKDQPMSTQQTVTKSAKSALTALVLAASLGPKAFAAAPLKLKTYTASATGFHVTSTLIEGEKDAVLVDAQFTRSDAMRLTAKKHKTGKNLK